MAVTVLGYPAAADGSRGWLRYMYRQATTEDNCDKDGEPHPHLATMSPASPRLHAPVRPVINKSRPDRPPAPTGLLMETVSRGRSP